MAMKAARVPTPPAAIAVPAIAPMRMAMRTHATMHENDAFAGDRGFCERCAGGDSRIGRGLWGEQKASQHRSAKSQCSYLHEHLRMTSQAGAGAPAIY
jgi:hypothetical protein